MYTLIEILRQGANSSAALPWDDQSLSFLLSGLVPSINDCTLSRTSTLPRGALKKAACPRYMRSAPTSLYGRWDVKYPNPKTLREEGFPPSVDHSFPMRREGHWSDCKRQAMLGAGSKTTKDTKSVHVGAWCLVIISGG